MSLLRFLRPIAVLALAAAPFAACSSTRAPKVPLLHRASEGAACTQPRAPGATGDCLPDGGTNQCGAYGSCDIGCTSDGDCKGGPAGRCNCTWSGGPYGGTNPSANGSSCTYDGCASDADCGGKVCLCRETALPGVTPVLGLDRSDAQPTVCASVGNCRVDADCGVGGYCSPSAPFECIAPVPANYGYYCHTPSDECTDDTDCPMGTAGSGDCAFDPTAGHWACHTVEACRDG